MTFKEAIENYKVWKKARKTLRNMRLFKKLLADEKSGMREIVQRNSLRVAADMVMNWLDKRGTVHCRFCPSTEQLKHHVDYLLCPEHFDAIVSKPSVNGHLKLAETTSSTVL